MEYQVLCILMNTHCLYTTFSTKHALRFTTLSDMLFKTTTTQNDKMNCQYSQIDRKKMRDLKKKEFCKVLTYTSLLVVYFLSIKASGAIHFIGSFPSVTFL